jgi:hypothetical protein
MANGLRSTCWVRSSVRRGGPLLWSTNRVGPSKRLAASGPDSARIRDTVRLTISGAVDPWSTEASSSAMPNSRQSAAKSRRRRPI